VFKIVQQSAWSRDVMPVRSIQLGQATCPIGGCPAPGMTDKAAAQKLADLLSRTLADHPECFEGEDLEVAMAAQIRLESFATSRTLSMLPQMTTLSDDENRVIAQAQGCQIVQMTKPGPITPKPAETVTGQQPTTIKTLQTPSSGPAPSAGTLPQPSSQSTNLLPVALGAAGALALLWALTR